MNQEIVVATTLAPDHTPTTRVVLEDCADNRLWRARLGVPGVYRVDPAPNETVFFLVQNRFNISTGRRFTQVFFLSHWIDGKCDTEVDPPARGERRPFLTSSVLFGKFDPDRLPKHLTNDDREDLVYDGECIAAGAKRYDEANPRRPQRPRAGRRRPGQRRRERRAAATGS